MEISGSDPKVIRGLVYTLAKQLDEQKKSATSIAQLFESDLERIRSELVEQCIKLLILDHEGIWKKSREILWRKGYYDFIAFVKKYWHKEEKENNNTKYREKLRELILEGIANYKMIAAKIEQIFDLNLQYSIDFSIIKDQKASEVQSTIANGFIISKSIETNTYALEIVHASFLSLGDLHRYFIDFNFDKPLITRDMAARFYFEAFKLNPSIGMAQNQLGTLYYSQNYDLDSIYHYLYSLICTVPFELSENNVYKLLLSHVDYLEELDPAKVEFSLRDFYARFYLIVDIFFFDKDVPDFNSLCHCVLVDLRKILCSTTINITEGSLFKIVSIMLFCISKLKMINSPKMYSLNAFLVAVCSDLIDACIVNLEQYVLAKSKQNQKFQEAYAELFSKFEGTVRKSRDDYKLYHERVGTNNWSLLNGHLKCGNTDSEGRSQRSEDIDKDVSTKENEKGGQSTRSSDEAKESDLKTPLSTKSKKRNIKIRRRRKKIQQSDDSSCYDTESDLDSDFSSNDELNSDYSDLSSNFESENSDMDDDIAQNVETKACTEEKIATFSDNEDMIIEEEHIIYPGTTENQELIKNFTQMNFNGDLLNFKSEDEDACKQDTIILDSITEPPVKLKYKNKYAKIDPNIIIDFAQNEPTMRCLKILFDWLRINQDILFSCYHTNPEFIHKIMKLLNYCNIDIFTRKVYFEREIIKTANVRKELDKLFDIRSTIPLSEDVILKNFELLQSTQMPLDWSIILRNKITTNEESIMRIFKMVDFGFFICKMKKFNYNFCAKTRRFTENLKKKREKKKSTRRRERRGKGSRKRGGDGKTKRYNDRKNGTRKSYTSNEEKDTVEETSKVPSAPVTVTRKGYLRNRNQNSETKTHTSSGGDEEKYNVPLVGTKYEIMGQLWLKSEVENLESKMKRKPMNVILTPYIVVDAKSLTEYTDIVKNLVKTRKFIVLIPNAVLCELDELKKNSDCARNAIRWLEQEFKRGNRHMRSQRDSETLTLTLLKVPKKLDREASTFLQIAQFCNYIVSHHSDSNEYEANVLTFLSGDNLNQKRLTNFSYTGILEAISVQFDQISNFYAKYKKK